MKVGIDSFCYHRYFGEAYPDQKPARTKMTLSDFLKTAADLEVNGVGIEAAFLPSLDSTYAKELKSEIDSYNFERIFSWGFPNGLESGLNEAIFDQMKGLIPFAAELGAPIMRIVASSFAWRRDNAKEQIDRLAPKLKDAARVAKDNGVKIAIENNIDFSAEDLLRLLETIDSEDVGLEFDSGNFVRLLDDPLRALDILASHTLAVHLKDVQVNTREATPTDWFFFSCVPVGQGLTNNQAILNKLAASGYEGYIGLQIDHPHTDWYGREDEMVRISVKNMKDLAANVQ